MRSLLVTLLGGNKSEKDLKKIKPYLEKIHTAETAIKELSNDALRAKTQEFKTYIQEALHEINEQITQMKAAAETLPAEQLYQQDEIYKQVDEKEKERNKQLEKALLHLLPEAFAVVKETARRFTDNHTLSSKATELDKTLSVKKEYITIEGENAVYNTTWTVAGNPIKWKMVHYDVQLIGGIVLHQGTIAEMATGEGKTLVSTLPAYLNALAGLGVHIVTVNDYLAKRDSEWNGTIFEWLGITVDCIDKYEPHSINRRNAYNADITYGTNNEFGFDYLRDNMVHEAKDMVQKKHHYAIVDEVDSVLIDDARTPLIISGPISKTDDEQQYFALRPRIQQIVEAQKKMVNEYLGEAKKLFSEGNDKPTDGGLALMRAQRGYPKNAGIIKFLSETHIKSKLQKIENYYLAEQEKEMPKVDEGLYFVINEKNKTVDLTTQGIEFLAKQGEDKNLFILPDLGFEIENIEKSHHSVEEKFEAKEKLIQDYTAKADRLHSIQQLLKAYTLFEKDVEYVVIEGEVKIVDEQTGRIMEGRRYSDGLHQAIEAKENVKIEAATQTYATITLQNFFRMYHKLAGMTGTAETEAGEFMTIYKLDVISIPTNIPAIRKDHQDLIYKTKREKYKAIIEEIEKLQNENRPILVGTTSVEVSELISKMLQQRKIPHNILNAKQHAREAQIVAEAGMPGTVTIATNMAGRGTDIKINDVVRKAGGLAIVGTERHESRRVDRQLRGRAGRQGDPGSSQFFISLEDDLMRIFGSERLSSWMDRLGLKEGEVIQHSMITNSITRAQKKVEENNFGIRKRLLEYDDVMNKQRNVIYSRRQHALFGERLALDIDLSFQYVSEEIVEEYLNTNNWENLEMNCIQYLSIEVGEHKQKIVELKGNDLVDFIYEKAIAQYVQRKEVLVKEVLAVFQRVKLMEGNKYDNIVVPITDVKKMINITTPIEQNIENNGKTVTQNIEKIISLIFLDEEWKENLRAMDDLRQSVQTAYLEQKDPLVIYKMEAFNLFSKMNSLLNKKIVSFLAHVEIFKEQNVSNTPQQNTVQKPKLQEQKDEYAGAVAQQRAASIAASAETAKPEPIRVEQKIGRNDPCPCGSGKKYKHCHGK